MIKHPILCRWLAKFPIRSPDYPPGPIATVLVTPYYGSTLLAPFQLTIINTNHLFYQSVERLNREAHFRFDKVYYFSFEIDGEPISRNQPLSDLNGLTLNLQTREGNFLPVRNLAPKKIWQDGDGILVLSLNSSGLSLVKVNPRSKIYNEVGRFENRDFENFKLPNTPDPRFAIIENMVISFYGFKIHTLFPQDTVLNFIDDFRILVQTKVTIDPLEWDSFVYNLETRTRDNPRDLSSNNRQEIDFYFQEGKIFYELFY